ncbi:helix-turn-helix domain-containing protein [Paenibacillus sp. N3.4]|uniref:helix-turn-helix domain-containing protein n=1 Tax=Paenibacillus sp. N3.4 TaxID=2603222 RepID=UPI0011C7CC77|nr:helix-turn-helix transcriptional regulator [Paenibacillus sp. N3.4]TXK79121.1 helix-turn-helix transcriptional regulator [Paenibacillus sp. N3.4]
MKTVGERIKSIRKTNHLEQKSFSQFIGVSQGTLSDIENNRCKPSFETMEALGKQFLLIWNG